jgi:hypothetical protein
MADGSFWEKTCRKLEKAQTDNQSFDPEVFCQDMNIKSESSEDIQWLSSTFVAPYLVHILVVIEADGSEGFLRVDCGNRDVPLYTYGPFNSLAEAKRSVGEVREAWTDA